MSRKHVRIEYRIRPDVDLGEVTRAIGDFVEGIRGHGADHRYTSYQDVADERHFVHVGDFAADVVAAMQTEPFFTRFSGFLRERCETPPQVTMLRPVASAR